MTRARRRAGQLEAAMSRPVGRQRTIRDWTPDLGDGQEWLAQLEREGWAPEYGSGVRVRIHGRDVVRYALIEVDLDHDGQ